MKLRDSSSYLKCVAAVCVRDSEADDQVHISTLHRIEPYSHRFEKLAQWKLFEYVGAASELVAASVATVFSFLSSSRADEMYQSRQLVFSVL